MVGNDAINRIDLLGCALALYQDNPDDLVLEPSLGPVGMIGRTAGELGYTVAAVPGLGYNYETGKGYIDPTVIATQNGTSLEIEGALVINVRYWPDRIESPTASRTLDGRYALDKQGRNVQDHEHAHASVAKDIWNKWVREINNYERPYPTAECAKIANDIVIQMYKQMLFEIDSKNLWIDMRAYAWGTPNMGEIGGKILKLDQGISDAEREIETLKLDFEKKCCKSEKGGERK